MSWIVESILNDRERIRNTSDVDSDEFNDLMIIERAIENLRSQGNLGNKDLEVLYNFGTILITDRNEKYAMGKKFSGLCERIAFYLGDYFTDEGYISHMANKYRLDDKGIEKARKYIKSRYKYMIMRKPINE